MVSRKVISVSALRDVASVTSGYTFRERLDAFPAGDIAVIQMKDIDDQDQLYPADLRFVGLPDIVERQRVNAGDLVLRARGWLYTAAVVPQRLERAVVAAPLMVVRPRPDSVLPEYLRWFINHPATQAKLANLAAGSYVRSLNKAAIENLEVPIPPLDRQRQIVAVAELAQRERQIQKAISGRRAIVIAGILARCARNTR